MMNKFISLRRDYPKFIYESYAWEWVDVEDGEVCAGGDSDAAGDGTITAVAERRALKMSFVFKVLDTNGDEAFVFEPSVLLSVPSVFRYGNRCEGITQSNQQINTLVFNCGMVELISYWKATCSPITQIVCCVLTDEQQAWWKHLYFNGLGEFFYVNGIDTDEEWFMRLQNPVGEKWLFGDDKNADEQQAHCGTTARNNIMLVPVGGGKDSCVTLELLKKADNFHILPFIVNPRGATEKCCARAGFTAGDIAVMYRATDPLLLEMNKQGFLNGHTPFSAMLAFYSTLAATLIGAKYVVLSNESSANEATVTTGGADGGSVNHQYSKSFEFEQDFRKYATQFLSKEIADQACNDEKQNNGGQAEYFSLLRPLSEAYIAKLFSQYPQYFDVFKSCNVGSKTDSWCGCCAKCLFVYIILAPFLPPEALRKIFNGKNLLDDMSLQKEFDALVGETSVKPFECIGTVSEINWALQHSLDKGALLDHYKTLAVSKTQQSAEKIFALNPNHALPPLFEDIINGILRLSDTCGCGRR
ncbi:MAG: hypothetical protein LBF01_01935 [Bacteroidales bacterium]|jgi:hypothetical protein|nr:hypothetical protein [Bacteroidales bacterium]